MALPRPALTERVLRLLRDNPVVALIGARQVGKSTLARQIVAARKGPHEFFDLENADDLARLADPMLALARLRGWIVLDEIQLRPNLFPTLRVLADRPGRPARFLILGSASPELLQQSAESLAGRIAYTVVDGLSLEEVGAADLERLWIRGGLPRAFLPRSASTSFQWRLDYVKTFVERDLPKLGIEIAPPTLRRFWNMLAHYHGQIWSSSEFARAFGVSDKTVKRYLEILTQTFVVRELRPWSVNIGKRQVKSPKVYIADSGVLHALLDLQSHRDVLGHPKVGASWEGFLVGQIANRLRARAEECWYWRTATGVELDLLVVRGNQVRGFEFKHTGAPSVTPGMLMAQHDLGLDRIDVIHAGDKTFDMHARVRAVSAERILDDIEPLR